MLLNFIRMADDRPAGFVEASFGTRMWCKHGRARQHRHRAPCGIIPRALGRANSLTFFELFAVVCAVLVMPRRPGRFKPRGEAHIALLCCNRPSAPSSGDSPQVIEHGARVQALALLYARGARDVVSNGTGQLALHQAVSKGHKDCVQYLLKNMGSDIDVPDHQGNTALMLAVNGDHLEVVQLLLARGANALHARNTAGVPLISPHHGDAHHACKCPSAQMRSGCELLFRYQVVCCRNVQYW